MTAPTAFTRIRVEAEGGVTHIVLNRPHRRNTIDLQLARELMEAALLEGTAASRCVVLRGEGEHFCAGGDLKSFGEQSDVPGHLLSVTSYLHAAIVRLTALPAPLVVVAQGHVAGAGLGLACAADILLTEEGATFRSAYAALGLTPDAGTSHLLPQLVGLRRATRMTHLGYVLPAEEAVEWGLCTECTPRGELAARAKEVATQLAAGPTVAYGQTTRLLHSASRRTLADHLEDEATTLSAAAATLDAEEGMAAFLERRTAAFQGSAGPSRHLRTVGEK